MIINKMNKKYLTISLLSFAVIVTIFYPYFFSLNRLSHTSAHLSTSQTPSWMLGQIERDLAHFHNRGPISKSHIKKLAEQEDNTDYLVHFEIKNNQVRLLKNFSKLNKRASSLLEAVKNVCRLYSVPNIDFLVSLHDALNTEYGTPLFVMAKNVHNKEQILIPDFDSLSGKYQILKNKDITQNALPSWEKKRTQLIWRGNSSQSPNKHFPILLGDGKCFSRVKLCELSQQYPIQVNAKITRFVDGWEKLKGLEHLHGNFLSYEEQIQYKYQMLIDGYTCSYSNSGWKWFSNSLVFKEDSDNVQWYYSALRPYDHFIPVSEGLGDLIEKIEWARTNDVQAKEIAARARSFALENITKEKDLLYLYHLFLAYSALDFVD
jgi:hypothetical protein